MTNQDDPYQGALGMATTARQEAFGDVFLQAVASVAGCAVAKPRTDNDSIDWTLSCKLPRRPKLDIQMKTTAEPVADGNEPIRYRLKVKNYTDLTLTELLTPRILVLVILPTSPDDWLTLTAEQVVLKRCAYWVSLAGKPARDNATTVTVTIPRTNLLTPEAVRKMMAKIDAAGAR
ncbi:MAG: DUF4365 domain-containing protein [Rhodospirillales bacterium]|nr:MAG: DUF4365 domain-containing protein [Rhodospirillales bacterium]